MRKGKVRLTAHTEGVRTSGIGECVSIANGCFRAAKKCVTCKRVREKVYVLDVRLRGKVNNTEQVLMATRQYVSGAVETVAEQPSASHQEACSKSILLTPCRLLARASGYRSPGCARGSEKLWGANRYFLGFSIGTRFVGSRKGD